jgi:hypothetical protein
MAAKKPYKETVFSSSFAENPGLLSPGMNAPAAAAVFCGQ